MAATMERLDEYRGYNAQFCKRVLDYLSIVFTAQGKMLLGDDNGVSKSARGRVSLKDHRNFETYLERYHGLLLYLKEMDETAYAKICAVSTRLVGYRTYFSIAVRHISPRLASCMGSKSKRCSRLIAAWSRKRLQRRKQKVSVPDIQATLSQYLSTGFSGATPTSNAAKAAQGMRRAGTIVRSPLERREKKEASDGEIRAADVS